MNNQTPESSCLAYFASKQSTIAAMIQTTNRLIATRDRTQRLTCTVNAPKGQRAAAVRQYLIDHPNQWLRTSAITTPLGMPSYSISAAVWPRLRAEGGFERRVHKQGPKMKMYEYRYTGKGEP